MESGTPFDAQSSNSLRPTSTGPATLPFPSDGTSESQVPSPDAPANESTTMLVAIIAGIGTLLLVIILIPIIIYFTKRYNRLHNHSHSINKYNSGVPPPRPPKHPSMSQNNRSSKPESFNKVIDAPLRDLKVDMLSPPLEIHPSNRRLSIKSTVRGASWSRGKSEKSMNPYTLMGNEPMYADNAPLLPASRSQRSVSIYSDRSNDIFTSGYPLPMTNVPIFEEYSQLQVHMASTRPASFLSFNNPFREREETVGSPRSAYSRKTLVREYRGKIRPGMGVQRVQRVMSYVEEEDEDELWVKSVRKSMNEKKEVPESGVNLEAYKPEGRIMNRTLSGRSSRSGGGKWVDRYR